MKKLLIGFTSLLLILAACAPQPPIIESPADQDGVAVPPTQTEQALDPVEEMAVKQLSGNLGFRESDISVVSNEETEFSDACLGVVMGDVLCAQVITPGRIIVLEAKDIQYEYHISDNGAHIQPATLALTWRREGGIAGFCDTLTVCLSGEVYGNKCRPQPDGRMETFASLFSATERKQFDAWVIQFGLVNLDASDPQGVSDRMVIELVFYGMGSGKPGKAEEKTMITWAQSLYQKLYS